jgi:N-acetylglutamate synthase-like GNAT family acetyltransferase
MNLVPLMPDTLVETQRLAAELFPWERDHQAALLAAVAPATHAAFLRDRGLSTVRFWTSIRAGQVVGLAGLYNYAAQPEETWLAWYGLHATARGQGKGAELLDWIIAEARFEQKRVLRLWTTDEDEYAKAIALYRARGFRSEPWAALPGETWRTIVLSLSLDGHEPMSWAQRAPRCELCGREAPQLVAVAA